MASPRYPPTAARSSSVTARATAHPFQTNTGSELLPGLRDQLTEGRDPDAGQLIANSRRHDAGCVSEQDDARALAGFDRAVCGKVPWDRRSGRVGWAARREVQHVHVVTVDRCRHRRGATSTEVRLGRTFLVTSSRAGCWRNYEVERSSSSMMMSCSALASAEPVPPRPVVQRARSDAVDPRSFRGEGRHQRSATPRRQPSIGFVRLDAEASPRRRQLRWGRHPPR